MRRDARDLARSAAAQVLGCALRLAHPALTWVAILLYGQAVFGGFVAAQAVLLLAMRGALLGLDKGIIWWVSRHADTAGRSGLLAALAVCAGTSVLAAALIGGVLAPTLATWQGSPGAATGLRWMAAGLVPMTLTQLLLAAALGHRRVGPQIVVRDGITAVALLAAAVALHSLGFHTTGLGLAFAISHAVALVSAVWMVRRVLAGSRATGWWQLPADLWRYALPMWLADIVTSIQLRLDVMLLAILAEPTTVGLYGAVMQLANAIRAVRRAFDPVVMAIVAQIGTAHDAGRLRAGFSRATAMVLAAQFPILALLVAFTPWLMARLGHTYAEAVAPLLLACGFFVANGLMGMNGLVVAGYGRTDLALASVVLATALQACLLWWLVPSHGLVGAITAVGLAIAGQNLVQFVQAARLTRTWLYDGTVGRVLLYGAGAGAAMAGTMLVAGHWRPAMAPGLGLAAFLLVFGTGLWWRRGRWLLAW